MPHYSPVLKKTCVRQVVFDRWFTLKTGGSGVQWGAGRGGGVDREATGGSRREQEGARLLLFFRTGAKAWPAMLPGAAGPTLEQVAPCGAALAPPHEEHGHSWLISDWAHF